MDEEIEIINTNTRVEKLKNFLISKRKQLITLLILIILILITFFGYQEFKSSSKEKLANKFNSIVTNFETGKKDNIPCRPRFNYWTCKKNAQRKNFTLI